MIMNRELDGIREAAVVTGCRNMTIITHEQEETIQDEQGTIRIVPAWKWFLQ